MSEQSEQGMERGVERLEHEEFSFEVPTVLGEYVPNDMHAVSVCLPTWEDTLGWANRDAEIIGKMKTGYPRFFVHKLVERLANEVIAMNGKGEVGEGMNGQFKGVVFPLLEMAWKCHDWVLNKIKDDSELSPLSAEIEMVSLLAKDLDLEFATDTWGIHVVIVPIKLYQTLRSFWQHTGEGISSRQAELCLDLLSAGKLIQIPTSQLRSTFPRASLYYSKESEDKLRVREMVAESFANEEVQVVGKEDVFLYASGMMAIYEVYRILLGMKEAQEPTTVVACGFNYLDTFKIMELFSPPHITAHMLGFGNKIDLDLLESWLRSGRKILAVFCEFPSNPLLRSPDLKRIRALSIEFGFVVVCDDTVGTSINLEILPWVDVVVTSLTKLFSGGCNVMGGTATISPYSPHHSLLHSSLTSSFIDTYFPRDAIIMSLNGSLFRTRVQLTSRNALTIAKLLHSHPSVETVYYPFFSETKDLYDEHKRKNGGYGYLISIEFKENRDAVMFLNALNLAKGPSLGTDFTLCCPYTLFAHYRELEWAASYGCTMHLIRVSVGRENIEELKKVFEFALAQTRALKNGNENVEGKESGVKQNVVEVSSENSVFLGKA